MIQRIVATLIVVAGVLAIACVDMSAPLGPAAISTLLLPSPSVVAGDSMRDSNGDPAPITAIGFDANGVPLPNFVIQLFLQDTARNARLLSNGVLFGEKIGAARLVGQYAQLQTPTASIPVTFLPERLVPSPIRTDTVKPSLEGSDTLGIGPVRAFVLSSNDSGSQGIIVHYKIFRAPVQNPAVQEPVVFLRNPRSGMPGNVDTTLAGGVTSMVLVVNARALGDPDVLLGTKGDSAIVELSASYARHPLLNSPSRIVVPIKVK